MLRPAKKAPAQKAHQENPMNALHYIGFDVHKKTISFCVKTAAGEIVEEGSVPAQRAGLRQWAAARPQPWRGAMEATLFRGWIYDTLKPYGEQLEMAHPAKMKAISAGKKKSDTIDARTIADLVRCNLLPACYVAPPRIRELRRLLRYRSLVVSEAVHEEQDGRAADGNRRSVREREVTPQEIFRQPAGRTRRGAGIGDRSAALEPRRAGDVREHAEATGPRVARRSRTGATRRAADDHSSRRRNHGSDLGLGGRRSATLSLQLRCHELLRTHRRIKVLGGQAATWPHLQTAQPLAADHADRGRQAGPAMESATGGTPCPRVGAWTSQPRHPGGGPQTRHLSAGRRQERPGLSAAFAAGSAKTKSCLTRKNFEPSGDPPAVPRQLGDWAEERLLPMLLTVCIEAGRKTLTHTSWTGPAPVSRKWMSGQAANLAVLNDRWPFANLTASSSLRDSTPPSARRPPSPLDFYLSWMSPFNPTIRDKGGKIGR